MGIATTDRFIAAPIEYHPDHLLEGFQSAIVFGQGNCDGMDDMGGFSEILSGVSAQGNVLECLKSEGYRAVNIRGTERNVSLVQMGIQAGLGEMSRTVDNLVNRGYVIREKDLHCRRTLSISLSKEGHEIFCRIEQRLNNRFKQIYSLIPQEKQCQVIESMGLLFASVSKAFPRDGGDK